MRDFASIVLWIYIVLLFVGGLIGFLKAGSKASLITSASFAGVLILCNLGLIFQAHVADIALVVLLIFFTYRLTQSKKFMPSGMMAVVTLVALVLRRLH
jgi:uncharacterized membrane protein (UPF0136 family)